MKAYFDDTNFIQNMYAWNKARPPLLRDARDTAANPPEIKAQDYKMYMQSYQHAFAICRHSAAPVYETVTVSRVRVFDYIKCSSLSGDGGCGDAAPQGTGGPFLRLQAACPTRAGRVPRAFFARRPCPYPCP